MFNELLAILAPIIIATTIGFTWGKLGVDFPTDFVSRIVMFVGTPCLIIGVMAKVEVEPKVMGQVAIASALVMLLMALLGYWVLRWRKLDMPTYLPSLLFPNNGNMGLPLCLFAFGQTGLALALGSFMVMMVATFTLGLVLMSSAKGGWLGRMASVAQQPVIYAMALAVVLLIADISLPRWLGNTLDLLGGIAIPLMTIALGVSLATLKVSRWRRSLVFSLARIGGGLLVCQLMGLTGVSRNVVLLQSAMPVAVFNYLLALRYDHHPDEVAAMVLISTLMAFLGLPFLLWFML
jgi:malate permease and related proteins